MTNQTNSTYKRPNDSLLLEGEVCEVEASTDVEFLAEKSTDYEIVVRSAVARHPLTPPDVLHTMSKDPSMGVRQAVAANPRTPEDALFYLAKCRRNFGVRWAVARNPSASLRSLLLISVDEDERVRVVAETRVEAIPVADMASLMSLSVDEAASLTAAPLSQRRSIIRALIIS